MKRILVFFLPLLLSTAASARPLITEEVATIGYLHFESGFSVSERTDEFGSPTNKYETIVFPFFARIGLHKYVDFGFSLRHITQRLRTNSTKLDGNINGQFIPEIKFSPSEYYGFKLIWTIPKGEKPSDNLPIGQGGDLETLILFKLPTTWPVHLNAGYVWKGGYNSQFGVPDSPISRIEPGNIWEGKLSMEIPLLWHINLLGETAYYNIDKKKIDGEDISGSAGDAMDALVGLNWAFGQWNLGAGIGFGLLDERRTSFELDRGAGDTLYKLAVSYKLEPRKPEDQ